MGLLPKEAIAVEDNLDGYKAAVLAKLECIAFGSMQPENTFEQIAQVTKKNVAQSVIDALESPVNKQPFIFLALSICWVLMLC